MYIQLTVIPGRSAGPVWRLLFRPQVLVLCFLLAVVGCFLVVSEHQGYLPVYSWVSAVIARGEPAVQEAVSPPGQSASSSRALLREVARKERQIKKMRSVQQEELDDLAVRLGELQGGVWHLEALSNDMLGAVGAEDRPLEASSESEVSMIPIEGTPIEGIPIKGTPEEGMPEGASLVRGGPGQGGPSPESLMLSPSAVVTEASSLRKELWSLEQDLQLVDQRLAIMRSLALDRKWITRIVPTGKVAVGWYSSRFGQRKDPFTGRREFHQGLDISGRYRSPVYAVAAGIVTWSGRSGGYGNLVQIAHGEGYVTRYGHNSKNLVQHGEWVEQGQKIALMGSTGRSTGVHVHFEVEIGGKLVNPVHYIFRVAPAP